MQPLNLITPINKLGYGQVGYYLARELSKLCDLHLTVIGQAEQKDGFIQAAISKPHHHDAPCVRIWHQHDMKMFIGRGKRIGFPIFELDTFTDTERHNLLGLDEIFVCSHWGKNVIEENGIPVPVNVVPLGVDTAIFNPSRSNPPKDKVVFFNCGKWEVRKGHPELAEAFNRAFKPSDNVELWLMCDNPFYPPELKSKFENMFLLSPMGRAGKIKLLPRVESHLQVAKLMGAATVGVFPAKAEGWNLELLEMMAIGKPVIASMYAGHTEFCNSDNATLLVSSKMERANDGVWFHGQGNWRSIDVDELTLALRHQYNMISVMNNKTNFCGIDTGKKFTWENSARKLLEYVESN